MNAYELMEIIGDTDEALLRRSERPVAALRIGAAAAATAAVAAVLLLLLLPQGNIALPDLPPIEEQGFVDIGYGCAIETYTADEVKKAHAEAIASPVPKTMAVEQNTAYTPDGFLPYTMTGEEADALAARLSAAFGYPEGMERKETRMTSNNTEIRTGWSYTAPDALSNTTDRIAFSGNGAFSLSLPTAFLQPFDLSVQTDRIAYAYSVVEALSGCYSFKEFTVEIDRDNFTLYDDRDGVYRRLQIPLGGDMRHVQYSVDETVSKYAPLGDYPILTEKEARALIPDEIENDGYPSFFTFPQGMTYADLTEEDIVFGGFRYTPRIAALHYSQPYYVFYIRVGEGTYREFELRAVRREYFVDENANPWA